MTNRKAYITVSLLALIFIVPLLAAWILFKVQPAWLDTGTNQGNLITPPLAFTQLKIFTNQQHLIDKAIASGRWRLLLVTTLPCQKECQDNIYKLRQIYRSFLNKKRQRIVRIWLTYQPIHAERLQQNLVKNYAGMQHYIVDKKQFSLWIKNLPSASRTLKQGAIYIVDPHDNMMMHYPLQVQYKSILRDLRKLLRVSQIG